MRKNKILKRIALSVIILITVITLGFVIYAMDYMHADDYAIGFSNSESIISLDTGDYILEGNGDTGIIFYPGAKVEEEAYIPLLEKLRGKGYTCFLVKMPLRFAFLGKNRADSYIEEHNEINSWYMAGHSLGGAMASSYASDNEGSLDGLILLGAYVYGNIDPDKTITIYGENDLNLDKTKLGV
ncbi:MAG TPA: alpha/beta hydrolase [Anaerovoracaceae bacterium]|nr:alpha/beta hydrolase [Anaerovoracaceae bacterium]